ncbi:hypothetical protein [Nocardia sp. NBC_01327]|uniref:hypothetical protein n=1 Tax=Nocardia sp. NBC_01327 TaxID=2903593 RepID=UPI002E0D8639|nr:hypothetical protein OG326_23985 [Nocardia sp. NBC_01327]
MFDDRLDQSYCDAADFKIPGITQSQPEGEVSSGNGWATIGTLVNTGDLVDAIPRLALSASQTAFLLMAAIQVLLFGRPCMEGWVRHGAKWIVDVKMRYPASDEGWRAAMRAIVSAEGAVPAMSSGLSRPLGK